MAMNEVESGMWEILRNITPEYVDISLHCAEYVYKIKDSTYSVMFELSSKSNVPFSITKLKE